MLPGFFIVVFFFLCDLSLIRMLSVRLPLLSLLSVELFFFDLCCCGRYVMLAMCRILRWRWFPSTEFPLAMCEAHVCRLCVLCSVFSSFRCLKELSFFSPFFDCKGRERATAFCVVRKATLSFCFTASLSVYM